MLAALEQGLDTLGQHIVVLDAHGRIEFATDGARRLLGAHRRERSRTARSDPRMDHRRPRPASAAQPLVLHRAGATVLVRLLPDKRTDHRAVLLLESGTGELNATALRSLGLTPREAETLRLTALGNTATQAATQMGIARRTVEKHLERVYAKLGVSSLRKLPRPPGQPSAYNHQSNKGACSPRTINADRHRAAPGAPRCK